MIKYKIFEDGSWFDEKGKIIAVFAGADEKFSKFAETHKIVKISITKIAIPIKIPAETAYILVEYESEDE